VQTGTHLGCYIPAGGNAGVLQAEAPQGHGGPDHVSWDKDVVAGPDGDRDPSDLALSGKIISL
jgi:hypothetical protein